MEMVGLRRLVFGIGMAITDGSQIERSASE